MKFEFSCKEILEVIGKKQKELLETRAEISKNERTHNRNYSARIKQYNELPFWKKFLTDYDLFVGMPVSFWIPGIGEIQKLQTVKTLLQTQPPDKIYSLTLEECEKYGLVGVNKQ